MGEINSTLLESLDEWRNAPGFDFKDEESEKEFKGKATRLVDAIKLDVPDRVPAFLMSGFFPAEYAGIDYKDMMYDTEKADMAIKKFISDFDQDAWTTTFVFPPGEALEVIDYNLYRWPGDGADPDVSYQAMEGEYMKPDEYDDLIQDPTEYFMRAFMPRIAEKLEPLKKLSSVLNWMELLPVPMYLAPYGLPDVQEAFKSLFEAGEKSLQWLDETGRIQAEAKAAGTPGIWGGFTKAPFDVLGDTLRGTQGIMLDMRRNPDKLKQAMEALVPKLIDYAVGSAEQTGHPISFIPLHKGDDTFMSNEHYKEFYWPTLKKVIEGLIDAGVCPWVFAEGKYDNRLEIIKDQPTGSVWHFDDIDMRKAKEVLGDTVCIAGDLPLSLTKTGDPEKVEKYCKDLIDDVGEGGGFILTNGATVDEAKPENVQKMLEVAKEYGQY